MKSVSLSKQVLSFMFKYNRRKGSLFIKKYGFLLIIYLLLINGAFVFLYPFIRMVSVSLMSGADYLDESINWIPIHFVWQNFIRVLEPMGFFSALANSCLITFCALAGQLLASSLVGYGFARISFPGRNLLFASVLITMVIPPQVLMIPHYIIFRILNWIDTLYPFMVPSFFGFGLNGALFIFFFRQVFKAIPQELDDAARIDGADTFSIYWWIMLPLAKPALLTVALFSFVWHWNEYLRPVIYLNSLRTLPLALSLFWSGYQDWWYWRAQGWEGSPYPLIMAASLLTILPCLLVYIFTQKYFLQSVIRAGLRGMS